MLSIGRMSPNKADVNQRDTTIFILCMPVLAHSKHHMAEDITSAKLFCVLFTLLRLKFQCSYSFSGI